MVLRTLFERVTRYKPVDTVAFLDYYNDTVQRLLSLYGEKYVLDSGGRSVADAVTLDDTSDVRDEYFPCVQRHILYLAGGNADDFAVAREMEENAYRLVWKKLSRGKILNIQATNDPYSAAVIRKGGGSGV